MSERKPAYPAHAPDVHEDEDEDDKPFVRPASRKELAEEKRNLDTDDEDLLPFVPSRLPSAAQCGKEKDLQCGRIQLPYWNKRCQRTRASEQRIPRFLGKKAEGEALRNIISKLSEERNLRDHHQKQYHMSTAQFKKRTIHLDIPGRTDDSYQRVVKTCPFCNSVKPRPERSRVSGLRAE